MDESELAELAERGLCVVTVDEETWDALEDRQNGLSRFSIAFPNQLARTARRLGLALVHKDDGSDELRLGLVRSIQKVASVQTRVNFDLVHRVEPYSLPALLRGIKDRKFARYLRDLEAEAPPIRAASPAVAQRVVAELAAYTSNQQLLRRLHAYGNKPTTFQDARALQHDALSLALRAFGGTGDASALLYGDDDTALSAVRLLEDAVIEHDARSVPGWSSIKSRPTGYAEFKRDRSRLEVFTANKRPLEELFGVDLIYMHRNRGSIVMLQYKMLEPARRSRFAEDGDWVVQINDQFTVELRRMQRFDRDTDEEGPYRLHPGAFYFKFVKRNARTNTAGIIVSLGHVEQLLAAGTSPSQGGLRISFDNLEGHYLRGDNFVALVDSGYVGTRGSTTDHLQALIKATLDGGRAVVAAIQSSLRER